MTLVIIPVNAEETATAWSAGLTYHDSITGWTPQLIAEIFEHCDQTLPDQFNEMDLFEQLDELSDCCGIYGMTHLIVVDSQHLPTIEMWSNMALIDEGGSDSAWYAACDRFNYKVLSVAEKLINLATGEVHTNRPFSFDC
jgi:hypothetical protein